MAKIHPSLQLFAGDIKTLLQRERHMQIATHGPGMHINLTPMTFGYAERLTSQAGEPSDDLDFALYFFGRGQKIANLRRNPVTTILVDGGSSWQTLFGIMVQGEARVLEDPEAEQNDPGLPAAQLNLGQKHGLQDDAGNTLPHRATAAGASRRWVVFTPEKLTTWDNSKLPS